MTEEYSDEDLSQWVDEIEDFPGLNRARFNEWKANMKKEITQYSARASKNIIDQLYPTDYEFFFQRFWTTYLNDIFGKTLPYWKENLKFIAGKIRNPEMHSRRNLINPEDIFLKIQSFRVS